MPSFAVKRTYEIEVVTVVNADDERLANTSSDNIVREVFNQLYNNKSVLIKNCDLIDSEFVKLFEGKLKEKQNG